MHQRIHTMDTLMEFPSVIYECVGGGAGWEVLMQHNSTWWDALFKVLVSSVTAWQQGDGLPTYLPSLSRNIIYSLDLNLDPW